MGTEDNTVFTRKLIASRLKKMRKFLKLTREDVAAYLGITREQYKDIEMGKEELLAEQLDTLEEFNFDACYLSTGIYSTDHLVRKALSVMPDKDYAQNMEKLFKVALPASTSNLSGKELLDEWGMISDILAELAAYGLERYNEKELRDVPEIRFLTNRIEEC